MRYNVKDLAGKKVKDKHGKLCPPTVVKALVDAGISSFGCRPTSLDWQVVRKDAKGLVARLGGDDASS